MWVGVVGGEGWGRSERDKLKVQPHHGHHQMIGHMFRRRPEKGG